jgi:hypothetical protein
MTTPINRPSRISEPGWNRESRSGRARGDPGRLESSAGTPASRRRHRRCPCACAYGLACLTKLRRETREIDGDIKGVELRGEVDPTLGELQLPQPVAGPICASTSRAGAAPSPWCACGLAWAYWLEGLQVGPNGAMLHGLRQGLLMRRGHLRGPTLACRFAGAPLREAVFAGGIRGSPSGSALGIEPAWNAA